MLVLMQSLKPFVQGSIYQVLVEPILSMVLEVCLQDFQVVLEPSFLLSFRDFQLVDQPIVVHVQSMQTFLFEHLVEQSFAFFLEEIAIH
jgi:hypothetical protein